MLKNISQLGLIISKSNQKIIKGGIRDPYNCYDGYTYCNNGHPNDFEAFDKCMHRQGCDS